MKRALFLFFFLPAVSQAMDSAMQVAIDSYLAPQKKSLGSSDTENMKALVQRIQLAFEKYSIQMDNLNSKLRQQEPKLEKQLESLKASTKFSSPYTVPKWHKMMVDKLQEACCNLAHSPTRWNKVMNKILSKSAEQRRRNGNQPKAE